jgi:polysaccharide export outer membrane protein
MRHRALVLPAILSMLASACSGGANMAALPSLASADQQYRLAPGDKIKLYVQGLNDLNNEYVVGDSGTLSLPYVQVVPVAGRSLQEIEQLIATRLAEQQILRSPVVSAQHVALRPFYILGEVRNPGEYAYKPGMTVMAAAALAGGFTYRATTGKVAITRTIDGREVTGSATQNTTVLPGDRIRVLERWF